MTITIAGVGLIGGSAAVSLRRTGFGARFIGVDNNEAHRSAAMWLGLVDEVMPLENAVKQSDLVILTIPVDAARKTLPLILDNLKPSAVVTDMGSTKNGICIEVENHPKRRQYVASHPIAGTEFSGPGAAVDRLFEGKKAVICEKELSSEHALQRILDMYDALRTEVLYMSSEMHDKHVAFVSHISHIGSFALGLTVLNIEKDEKNIFNMAGSGFGSTVRLAKSSPDTWAPIFMQNADSISFALDDYIKRLQEFKTSVDNRDAEKLKEMMRSANRIKKIIE